MLGLLWAQDPLADRGAAAAAGGQVISTPLMISLTTMGS